MHLFELKNITQTYEMAAREVHEQRPANLMVDKVFFVALMGASGFSKLTLINVLGIFDSPTSDEHLLEGTDVANLKDNLPEKEKELVTA